MLPFARTWVGQARNAALLVLALTCTHARADKKADGKGASIPVAEWLKAPTTPVTSAEIDRLIAQEHKAAGITPAPRTTDEQFIRRIHLDLSGKLPSPSDITTFIADKSPDKRAKLIDKLLESDEFASHWAAYWREVVGGRLTANQGRGLQRNFEKWLSASFKENKKWSEMVKEMLTFSGQAKFDDEKAGPAFFLGGHIGQDSVVEQAAETSRVFLGIQMNCAQCHDHPFDVWKREQFHELAAYFARIRPRPLREEQRIIGIDMSSVGAAGGGGMGRFGGPGEHRMPNKNSTDRFSGTVVHPKFIDGKTPGKSLADKDRRGSLVNSITSKDNPWFAGAFVNRIWGEMMGQSFYMPIDDLGPQKEAVAGPAITRIAGSFRGSDYDIKQLYRVIANSETYQRQSRTGQSGDHMLFAAVYPTRLRPNALWDSMQHVLGRLGGAGPMGFRPGGMGGRFGGGGLEQQVKGEFNFDPSTKSDDVEGSIPQALILMNNPAVQERIKATGGTFLARVLADAKDDGAALEKVYLQTLARRPTDREKTRCLEHLKKSTNRGEAFEDVLWALLNSTEFQTRR